MWKLWENRILTFEILTEQCDQSAVPSEMCVQHHNGAISVFDENWARYVCHANPLSKFVSALFTLNTCKSETFLWCLPPVSVNAAFDFPTRFFIVCELIFTIVGKPFIGLIYIDAKGKAMSLPDGFIENPNKCLYWAATKIKENNSLSRSLWLSVNESLHWLKLKVKGTEIQWAVHTEWRWGLNDKRKCSLSRSLLIGCKRTLTQNQNLRLRQPNER